MDFSDDMVDEIFDIFQAESEEIITRLNENLLALEKKHNDKDAILLLFRDAHSLKGAARMIGLNDIQTLAHKIEDVLGLAKEDKLVFNDKVINILYSAVDFLAEFIEKSIKKRKQVYSENFSKQMELLESIVNNSEETNVVENTVEEEKKQTVKAQEDIKNDELIIPQENTFNTDDISENEFQQKQENVKPLDQNAIVLNSDRINDNIIKSLYIFMKMEQNCSEDLIKALFKISLDFRNIFSGSDYYDISNYIENIALKLQFTIQGSGILTEEEVNELHNNIDNIIDQLGGIYEIFRIPIVDYYGEVFEIQDDNFLSNELSTQEIQKINEQKPVEQPEPANTTTPAPVNDNIPADIQELLDMFEKLSNNMCSVEEVNEVILKRIEEASNSEIKKILNQIQDFLTYSMKEEVRLTEDVFNIVNEALNYCVEIKQNNFEDIDVSLILNRLLIVKQVLELDNQKSDMNFPANSNQEKLKKVADVTDVFNTGEIKVLRVDSAKLDELIKQVNELTIEKIKTRNHINEMNKILKESNDCQKDLNKLFGFLKYNEKKLSDENTILFSNILKQFKNSLATYNKNLQKIGSRAGILYRKIQENDMKLSITTNNISNMVKNIRILPFGTIFHLFGRMVRDIAQEKGKKINFEIEGSEICADKKIIEEIKAPLIHIIRNSIDHGIETPEERTNAGKPEEGNITLSAYQTTNKVILEIKDDGRGINIEKIKEKAITKGFLTKEELAVMNEEQITSLIFAPGFSTGDTVTDISGRGIGLDVVLSKITQLNGKVKVMSEYNVGCCTRIILPTTMAIMKAFIVEINSQYFAIPVDAVKTFLRKSHDEIVYRKNKKSIIYENETINLFDLSEILGIKTEPPKTNKKLSVLILANEDKSIAISIDKLIGEQEIMHKKLAAPFYKLKNISGITTLVSGEVCLILNINNIINNQNSYHSVMLKPIEETEKRKKILLVDDSITTIMLEKNILTKSGYEVAMASNPIEAFKYLEAEEFKLIITDYEMPEMDGLTFLKKLKADKKYSKIPVILMSSVFNSERRSTAISYGASEYISKLDFNQDTFQKIIKDLIKKD